MLTAAFYATLISMFYDLIKKLLFVIGSGLCWIVSFLLQTFEKVSGLDTVTYRGSGLSEERLLIKVIFGNSNINTIYWGMALIGIVMCFGFTIAAVIKKSGDMGDKMKQSMGDILKNCFKSITIILLMNFIISATISITTTLLSRINYLITNAQNIDMSYEITFDSDDYATMARSLNTIGNYSLNASYNSRYNLNCCYNDIREDLKHLADKGVFDYTYITTTYDEDGTSRVVNTWQSVLENIYRSVEDIDAEQPLDNYNKKLSNALLDAMDVIRNDASFAALESYRVNQTEQVGETVAIDRMIMLLGSMAQSSTAVGKNSGFTDYLRGPYYYGQKDIYDYSTVSDDFDMSIGTWLYLTVIIVAFLFVKEMLTMVFNATARIFNMLLLYVSAPPLIAVTPLDDGGKLKQWTTAFIIQSFGLFGTVISLRLVIMFLPMLFSGDIKLFDSLRADTLARIAIMYGAIFTARKAGSMITGILADNAGMQAINAGDMSREADSAVDKGKGVAMKAGSMGLSAIRNDLGYAKKGVSAAIGAGFKASASKPQPKENKPAKTEGTLDMGSKTSSNNNSNNSLPNSQTNTGSPSAPGTPTGSNTNNNPKPNQPASQTNTGTPSTPTTASSAQGTTATGTSSAPASPSRPKGPSGGADGSGLNDGGGGARDYQSGNRMQLDPMDGDGAKPQSKDDSQNKHIPDSLFKKYDL